MYETCYVHAPIPCKLHKGEHDAEGAARMGSLQIEFQRSADILAAELKSVGYTGGDIVNYFIHWAERWGG